MTDNVIQLRDYQNPKDLERLREAERLALMEVMNTTFPSVYGFNDPDRFHGPDKEPA